MPDLKVENSGVCATWNALLSTGTHYGKNVFSHCVIPSWILSVEYAEEAMYQDRQWPGYVSIHR